MIDKEFNKYFECKCSECEHLHGKWCAFYEVAAPSDDRCYMW